MIFILKVGTLLILNCSVNSCRVRYFLRKYMDSPIPACRVDVGDCVVLSVTESWGTKYIVSDTRNNTTGVVVPFTQLSKDITPMWMPQSINLIELRCTVCFQECDRVMAIYEELDRHKDPDEEAQFKVPLQSSPEERSKRQRHAKK